MNIQAIRVPSILYLLLCAAVSFSVFAADDSTINSSVKQALQSSPDTASAKVMLLLKMVW